MKILKKKGFCNKLIIVLLAIIIVNMLIPMHEVKASNYEVGGALLKPIVSLVLKLGDGLVDLIHKVIYGSSTALLEYDISNKWWEALWVIGAVVITIIVAIILASVIPAVATAIGGIAAKVGLSVGSLLSVGANAAVGTIIKLTIPAAIIAAMYTHYTWFGDVVVLPLYQISPQEIFEGKVEFLNANFFTTEIQEEEEEEEVVIENPEITVDTQRTNIQTVDTYYTKNVIYYGSKSDEAEKIINEKLRNNGYTGEKINLAVISQTTPADSIAEGLPTKWVKDNKIYEATIIKTHGGDNPSFQANDNVYRLTLKITSADPYFPPSSGQVKPAKPIINSLKPTVARWYYALRTFAIILMMTELVYIGIRMMLCSVASEKAKYKNMLMDWVIAMCLLFFMHYIMAFSNIAVDSFTKVVNTLSGKKSYPIYINDNEKKIQEALKKDIDKLQLEETIPNLKYITIDENGNETESGGTNILVWDASNLMGLARVQAQIQGPDVAGVWYIGYTIAFLVLVCYTVFFLFVYIKRLIYLSFLTMISPLVALTYPIDKINDGKAQAFDMWFKEYIFNLLIQPFHLILYTVLITSAFDLASENILYTLVAIGFLMPAEKLLRKFFGFEKAQTPGLLGGAAGAALAMSGMNKLLHKRPHKQLDNGNSSSRIKESEDLGKIETDDDIDDSILFGGLGGSLPSRLSSGGSGSGGSGSGGSGSGGSGPGGSSSGGSGSGESTSRGNRELDIEPISPQPSRFKRVKNNLKKAGRVFGGYAKSSGKGLWAYGKSYGKQKIRGFAKGTKRFIEKTPRMLAGAAVATAATTAATTIAIASGDPKNLLSYGGAGIVGGYALGSSLINPNEAEKEKRKQDFERAYYGSEEEYKKAKLAERTRKYIKDENTIREMQNYLSSDEKTAKEALKQYEDCVEQGMDLKDIAAIKTAVDSGWSRDKAIKTAKTLKKAGGVAPSKMDDDQARNWKHRATKMAQKSGVNSSNMDTAIENMNKTLDDFYKVKDGLNKIKR